MCNYIITHWNSSLTLNTSYAFDSRKMHLNTRMAHCRLIVKLATNLFNYSRRGNSSKIWIIWTFLFQNQLQILKSLLFIMYNVFNCFQTIFTFTKKQIQCFAGPFSKKSKSKKVVCEILSWNLEKLRILKFADIMDFSCCKFWDTWYVNL